MAKQYDLETQSWIGEDDPPVDVNVLREDILKFWSETMKDDELPLSTRRGIAKDAAPYLLPRLAVVATGNANDLADRLLRPFQTLRPLPKALEKNWPGDWDPSQFSPLSEGTRGATPGRIPPGSARAQD